LTTIAGGKYTTYRVMAARLVDAAARALGASNPSVTEDVPLLGAAGLLAARRGREVFAARAGVSAAAIDALIDRYGDRVQELVALIEARPELAEPLDGARQHLRAEVVYACTHEGALRLEDVLARRTRLALTAPDRGLAAAGQTAALMAETLGWSAARTQAEVETWGARVAAWRWEPGSRSRWTSRPR
jgi:glycerol-3-phosphate dehydrogenase